MWICEWVAYSLTCLSTRLDGLHLSLDNIGVFRDWKKRSFSACNAPKLSVSYRSVQHVVDLLVFVPGCRLAMFMLLIFMILSVELHIQGIS